MIKSAMDDSIDVVEEYQKEIMGSLDQLDDLLAFTEFKETQTDIIHEISRLFNFIFPINLTSIKGFLI